LRYGAQPDDFSGQEKALDLLPPFDIVDVGLNRAAPHGRNRVELVTFSEYMFAFLEGTDVFHEHVQLA
jgi:hypothetical protein